MGIHSLEETEGDPDVLREDEGGSARSGEDYSAPAHHGDQVHVSSASPAPQKWTSDSSSAENHDFDGVSVLGSETERSGELVVEPEREEAISFRRSSSGARLSALV